MVRGLLTAIITAAVAWPTPAARGAESAGRSAERHSNQGPSISVEASQQPSCLALTRIRFYPRQGFAQRMFKGRFSGSNAGKTTDFVTLAEIKETPPEGQWTEIQLVKPVRFRYLKFESPAGGWGNVAEVEFYSGDRKIPGEPFGTAGSKDHLGSDFSKALDGKLDTFFDGVEPNNQYVGIDLGSQVQAAAPEFLPKPGAYLAAQEVTITSATPGAKIRLAHNWGTPRADEGEEYRGPIKLAKGAVLVAVAYTDQLAASPLVIAPYRIGEATRDAKAVRTFHIGNSLTDTVDGWLKPVAESAGRTLDFHRFTIPGAPTDWLWNHPGGGFGDCRYPEAFFVLAPIDHIFTQPFHGHDRSIENEVEYSGKFFDLCRKHSPDVQAWLYVQWPGSEFQDRWSQAKGATTELKLQSAKTWQEGVANHVAYTEAVAERINKAYQGKPVRIVPGGTALAMLKTEVDAGRVPGMKDFFAETFADGIHLTPKGRYLISLVHYACIYRESPEGKVSPLTTGLTNAQAAIFLRIAWEAVRSYQWTGVNAAAK
jgi:hypothetical protein